MLSPLEWSMEKLHIILDNLFFANVARPFFLGREKQEKLAGKK